MKLQHFFSILSFAFITHNAAYAQHLDLKKTKITASFKQMNVAVEAPFKQLQGTLQFDANKPENSKAQFEITIASFDLGDPQYNQEVLKKEWFNAAQFPKAIFVLSSLKPTGANKFLATGQLTIKGIKQNVSFTLTNKKEATGLVFEGTLPIKRLSFNIGEGEWKDTSMVADEVLIKFYVVTTP